MTVIYFVTGNQGKFREAQKFIHGLQQIDIDVPEIQSLDPQEIIAAKLEAAARHGSGRYIVEDTSLSLEKLNGFPGPLIKWMLTAIGTAGISRIAAGLENQRATGRTVIGYADASGETIFFEGTAQGTIVEPAGEEGFGWDDIFQPDGFDQTYAEMGPAVKAKISPRAQAFTKLAKYLKQQSK